MEGGREGEGKDEREEGCRHMSKNSFSPFHLQLYPGSNYPYYVVQLNLL